MPPTLPSRSFGDVVAKKQKVEDAPVSPQGQQDMYSLTPKNSSVTPKNSTLNQFPGINPFSASDLFAASTEVAPNSAFSSGSRSSQDSQAEMQQTLNDIKDILRGSFSAKAQDVISQIKGVLGIEVEGNITPFTTRSESFLMASDIKNPFT